MYDQYRCPNCGKYQETDPDGYYANADEFGRSEAVLVFCNENCLGEYRIKQVEPDHVITG